MPSILPRSSPQDQIDAARTFATHEILFAGANGFVGKVTLALLLDRYPDLKHLHVIVRAKRGFTPRERFEKDVLASPPLKPVIARLDPAVLKERVSVHKGDMSEPLCGLSEETIASLQGRVRLIINCAGLVEFTPPVDESFKSNVDGVENTIALAKRLGARICHISTCFVCGECDGLVEEDEPVPGFYPRRKSHEDHSFHYAEEIRFMRERIAEVYAAARARGEENTKDTKQRLSDLGVQRAAQWGWVNTYTYSKSLGEQLLAGESGVEYTIVRPAIVEAALDFPFPGWVEGGRTAAPLIMMAMSGLRHWPLRPEAPLEVVPVDQVASAILIASALLMNGRAHQVYQIGTAEVNPVPLKKLVEWMYADYCKSQGRPHWLMPGVRILSPAHSRKRGERLLSRIQTAHEVTNAVKRFAQRSNIPGRKPVERLARTLRTLGIQLNIREQALVLYQPFMHDNRFIFEAENIREASLRLTAEDQGRLPWTPEKIVWKKYWMENEVRGIQKWVQEESSKGRSFKL
ncbi:MAG: NAD-dependent epimerase/dehydratase family protein [Acidobacteria bacterium]|nr:NAD-dependent epimerase/dehydratase family protein [Acidobacteriota bacterium]